MGARQCCEIRKGRKGLVAVDEEFGFLFTGGGQSGKLLRDESALPITYGDQALVFKPLLEAVPELLEILPPSPPGGDGPLKSMQPKIR